MQVGGPRVHCPRSRSTPSAGIVLEPISLLYRRGVHSLPFHSGSSERSRYLRRGQFARPVDLAAHRLVVSPPVGGDRTVWLAPFFSFYEYRRICLLHLYVIRRIAAQRLKQGAYLGEVNCEGRDAILVQTITRCRPTQIALPRRPAKRLSRWPSMAIISIHAPLTTVGQSSLAGLDRLLRCVARTRLHACAVALASNLESSSQPNAALPVPMSGREICNFWVKNDEFRES